MSKRGRKASIIAGAVLGAGLAIGAATTGVLLANQPLDVTYYANNGKPAVSAQIKKGDNSSLPTPTREGYNFAGWYTDTNLTQQVTSTTKLKQNSKLYAGWELANYEVAALNETNIQAETVGLKSIGKYAFAGSQFTGITIPDTVTSIGEGAFSGCANLLTIVISENVTTLGDRAFANCPNVTRVTINATNLANLSSDNKVFYNIGKAENGVIIDFGDNVEIVPNYLFENSENITGIHFNKISQIGEGAFRGCTALDMLEITENVSTIGRGAFDNCTRLGEINFKATDCSSSSEPAFVGAGNIHEWGFILNIYSNVKYISDNLFKDCEGLVEVRCSGSDNEEFGDAGFGDEAQLESIGSSAFENCIYLKTLTIPEKVTNIGGRAFVECTSLRYFNFNAKACANFSFDNTVFDHAGVNTSSGMEIIIGDEVTAIPNYFMFSRDAEAPPYVKNITFGQKIKSIGKCAFHSFSSISEINLPNSLEVIYDAAFAYCTELYNVKLPNSLQKIDISVFAYCSKLHSVYIPSSVQTIAWLDLPSLSFLNTTPPFFACDNNLILVCEAESKPTGWKTKWDYNGYGTLRSYWGVSEEEYDVYVKTDIILWN